MQKKDISAAEAQVIARKTMVTLQGISNDYSFSIFLETVNLLDLNYINDLI